MSLVINDFNLFDIGWLDAGIKGYYWMFLVSASKMEKLQPSCGVHIFEKGIFFFLRYTVSGYTILFSYPPNIKSTC